MAKVALLWKRLTQTDFNAMHGIAKQAWSGGGAMHIALGTVQPKFPLRKFLGLAEEQIEITHEVRSLITDEAAAMSFRGNPGRRGGEWVIQDQRAHRHPAWQAQHGFPAEYDADDAPIVFILRDEEGQYSASFLNTDTEDHYSNELVGLLRSKNKGIVSVEAGIISPANIKQGDDTYTVYAETIEELEGGAEAGFDPTDVEDARKKIVATIVSRQGQGTFRKQLLEAYQEKCCITQTGPKEVLEAAHITPYMGPATNHVTNGLLLRADLHTLWDLDLLAIDPDKHIVLTSSKLDDTPYHELAGKPITLPGDPNKHPSVESLRAHLASLIA